MTGEEFLKKQNYTKTVNHPKEGIIEPTFNWDTVVRLLEEYKAENLPISDVVLLSSLDVGDRFAIEDEEDIIGDDYYEVLGKSTTSILCKKPSGRNDRYFPETRVKRI